MPASPSLDHLPSAGDAALAARLARPAQWLRVLTVLGMVVTIAAPMLVAIDPSQAIAWGLADLGGLDQKLGVPREPSAAAARRCAWVSLIPAVIWLAMLWNLWRLGSHYRRGEVFSGSAMLALRRFAEGMLALALLTPFVRAAMSAALTWDNPPGQRVIQFSLGSTDYLMVVLAIVLLLVARVMTAAAAMAEENRGIV